MLATAFVAVYIGTMVLRVLGVVPEDVFDALSCCGIAMLLIRREKDVA